MSDKRPFTFGQEVIDSQVKEIDRLSALVTQGWAVYKPLLVRCQEELEHLTKGESCDHSVNICWCEQFRLLEDIREALK